jgi:hypothetical protein
MRSLFALLMAGLLALDSSATAAPAAPPAMSQAYNTLQAAKQAYDIYLKYNVQADGCRWGRPTLGAIMFRNGQMWKDLAAIEDPAGAKAIGFKPNDKLTCSGSEDRNLQSIASAIYWEWMTRLRIMADLARQPGWGNGLAQIPPGPLTFGEPLRADIQKFMVTSQGQEKVNQQINQLQQEAVLVLNLACEPRKTFKSPTPRACPQIPANLLSQRPAAMVRLQAVESLASYLVTVVGQEQRGEFGTAYRLSTELFDLETKCKPHDLVIYPASPDTKEVGGLLEVSVHRFGEAGVAGRVTVKNGGGSYSVIDGGTLVKFSGFTAPRFGYCSPS